MAENITTLGIEVKTSGVQQAASDLQKLSTSAKSTEQSTSGMVSALDRVNSQIKAMGDKAKGASNAAQGAWKSIETGIKPVEHAVQKVAKSFDEAAKSAEGFGASSAAVAKGGVAAFAIIKAWEMVAANIGKAIEAADEYTRIESRLRQLSGGASGAVELQKELYTVAQESRQSFVELANTYAQVARATQDLGISQSELMNITKTVSQAVSLSGSSTQAAQAAMVQFSQAMASGTLRGEELNSIMEQTPRLAQAIAQGMGIGIGELRRLGAQGELTAQQVLGAIAKSAGDIDREFKSMTPTVADGFTKLGNSAKNFIDVLNDATGASEALYRVLNSLSGAMDFTAKNVATGVQNAKTGVLEAEIGRLKNQIGSLGKGDFRLSSLQSQLDAKQADLFKARGSSLAGGAEMPVLQNPAAKGPSADYLALTQKMSGVSQDFHKHLKVLNAEYGRTGNLKNYQAEVKKLIETETQIGKESAKKPRSGGGGRIVGRESDEAKAYEQALKAIASAKISAEKSTLSLTAAESALFDLQKSPVWASMPETWKQTAIEQSKSVAEYERVIKFMKDVEAQEQANQKAYSATIDHIADLEKQADLYGLTASQINQVNISREEEAIALASSRGAYAEHIAFMEKDLELKKQLAVSYEKNDVKRLISGTDSEVAKRKAADIATLDRARASGEISGKVYQEAIDKLESAGKAVSELDEFTKQAARNMQDAMADLFLNPTKDGMDSLVESFGKTLQKMIVQAGSAQLMNIMFGDMGKTGKIEGVFGDVIKSMKDIFTSKRGATTGGAAAGVGAAGILPGEWDWLDGAMKDMRVDMKGVLDQISKSMKDVLSSISSSFSSIDFGSVASSFIGLFAANGYAFNNGQVQKFANGGAFGNGRILTHPTMFAMGGTFGVAGEAGPEGALPLKRMSNGKLGVHMSGGGGMTINQTINAGAGTDKAEVRRAAASGARSVLGVANGARRYG